MSQATKKRGFITTTPIKTKTSTAATSINYAQSHIRKDSLQADYFQTGRQPITIHLLSLSLVQAKFGEWGSREKVILFDQMIKKI